MQCCQNNYFGKCVIINTSINVEVIVILQNDLIDVMNKLYLQNTK